MKLLTLSIISSVPVWILAAPEYYYALGINGLVLLTILLVIWNLFFYFENEEL